MKRLPLVILLVGVLVAVVTGCGGAHRYDARLVAADSLMQAAPDSALALVEALPPDSLTDEGDRAYRDLLLTQSRYRCYITATSDSGINRALSYYRAHAREREKLTRAFIYKGAVMEELGHPDSAMFYYKHAEATADEKDYVNLGQINTRIANLYRLYFGDEQTCYDKYRLAYYYHSLSGNKKMQLNNMYNMLIMVGITQQENAENLYNKALSLAQELKDSIRIYELHENRCRQLSRNDSTLDKSKRIGLECLSDFSQYISNDLLLDLAFIYCIEGKTDSASFYINSLDENLGSDEESFTIRKHEILSLIAMQDGNPAKSGLHAVKSTHLSDSVMNAADKYSIEKVEKEFNHQQDENNRLAAKRLKWFLCAVLLITTFIITIFVTLYFHRMRHIKSILKELENAEINIHDELFSQLDAKSTAVERLLTNLVSFMKSCAGIGMHCSTTETVNCTPKVRHKTFGVQFVYEV